MAARSGPIRLSKYGYSSSPAASSNELRLRRFPARKVDVRVKKMTPTRALAMDRGGGGGGGGESEGKMNAVNTNYVVPFEEYTSSSSIITRPLAEILRDLNKRIPETNITLDDSTRIPWFSI